MNSFSAHAFDDAAHLRAVLDTTVDAIITINTDGNVLTFNRAAESMFQWSAADMIGRNVSVLMPSPYQEKHDDYIQEYLRTGRAKIIGIGREVLGQRKDGTTFPVYLAVSEVLHEGSHSFTAILRDLTQYKLMQRAVVSAGDTVRREVGNELHDALGQQMTAMSLLAKSLETQLDSLDQDLARMAAHLHELTREGMTLVKRLVRGLYPTALHHQGIVVALEDLADTHQQISGITCRFSANNVPALSLETEWNLYRIAQEAVTNSIRHSRASRIDLVLASNGEHLELTVSDDGVGWSQDEKETSGLGLLIMKYRASAIGATLHLHTPPGGGAGVICHAPLQEAPVHRKEGS